MEKWKILSGTAIRRLLAAFAVLSFIAVPSVWAADANRAVLTNDVSWSKISWEDDLAYDPSLPVEFKITKAVSLTFDSSPEIVKMSIKGGYRLTLVPTKVPKVYDFETDDSSAIAIQGGTSSTKAITWGDVISISGKLITTGYLRTDTGGGAIVGKGTVVVESGSLDLRGSRWELNEYLALELCGGATIAGTGDSYAAIDICGIRSIRVAKGASTSAKITAPIRFRSDSPFKTPSLTIDEGASLTIDSVVDEDGYYSDLNDWAVKVGGQGSLVLNADAELPVAADSFCAGGVTGAGELVFSANPTASGVAAWFVKSAWNGTCAFRGATVNDFSPAKFGNAKSKIRFRGAECAFVANPAYAPELVLDPVSERYPFSLEMSAPASSLIALDSLSGSGKLIVRDGGFRVFAPRSLTGSIIVEEGTSGVVIGAYTEEQSGSLGYGAGQITVLRGTSEIAAGSAWSAASGIVIAEAASINDHGEILSPVLGGGKVIYDGTVASFKPEAAAKFTDANSWSGTVDFVSATLPGCDLSVAGNDESSVIIEGAVGSIAAGTLPFSVQLRGDGFKVTDALPSATVTFSAVSGNGAFVIASGNLGPGSSYRILDPFRYSGAVTVTGSSGCSLVIGDAQREADGVLQVADGCVIKSKRNWTATQAIFGKTLYVDGALGDPVMRVTGPHVDFSGVQVHLVNDPIDSRRRYKLEFNGSTKQLVIAETITPPSVDVDGVDIVYGTDFTNAVVRVSVTNFWEGFEFSGQAIARFRVYNANGVLIGAGDRGISADGTFDIGSVNLPGGRGSDFRYEVEVVAVDDAGAVLETVESLLIGAPAAHDDSKWFSENAETFKAGGADGTWKYREGEAFVTNGNQIAVRIFDDGVVVRYVPARDVTNDIVRVQTEVIFETAVTPTAIPSPTSGVQRLAGITLVNSGDARADIHSYAVWVPDEDDVDGGSFVPASGTATPTLGVTHKLEWMLNYRSGYLTYFVDGGVLTNADGVSSFRIPASFDRTGKTVCYSGAGLVNTLDGELANANLAAVDKGGATSQYDTIEDAVAAAGAGEKVKLLWDASWKPLTADVGRTIVFDADGHQLTIDASTTNRFASEGYCVTDLGGGSYRIDVITYQLFFEPNGADGGEMSPQTFSVTNLVFELAKNKYKREGNDFKAWNQFADGSGETNWEDSAIIDMTPYGLANMTLYAQWKLARHCIVVEAADEFVYIERVTTNGVVNSGVRYFQGDAAKATGKAEIPVLNGSDLVIRFSTDIEKRLTFEYVKATEAIVKDGVIRYEDLPQVYKEGVNVILDPIHEWAASRGIAFSELSASVFSQSSFGLDLDRLLTSGSEVLITDFKASDSTCSFRVTIDGRMLDDAARILPMIRVTDDLDAGEWRIPEASEVSVDGNGTVMVSGARFVKIVIPENG